MNRKLQEYQRHVKSPVNIATFMRFGLWNYNFLEYSFDPEQARNAAKDFREKFYNVIYFLFSSRNTTARRVSSRLTPKNMAGTTLSP